MELLQLILQIAAQIYAGIYVIISGNALVKKNYLKAIAYTLFAILIVISVIGVEII